MAALGPSLDDLARDLASGSISRRTALRRLAAGALGLGLAATPSALADELERGRCPKSRRCGKKCCPKGARCKNGKCKCKGELTKCGKKCVDFQTDAQNCGACGETCDPGKACVGGQCQECLTPDECPAPGECQVATCQEGTCGTQPAAQGTDCTGGICDDQGTCVPLEGCGGRVCGTAPNGDQCGVCGAGETCTGQGACVCQPNCPGTCGGDDGCGGICECPAGFVCEGGQCVGELCNGVDDDGDGLSDEDFPDLGEQCECSPGVFGVKACSPDQTGTICVC